MAKTAWLIYTDLDASLLDASYQWREAEPALEAIRALGVPLILNSSKTLAEMLPLAAVMDPLAPIIAENGTVLAYPQEADLVEGGGYAAGSYQVKSCGMKRSELLSIAENLRGKHRYSYKGFSEMKSEQLMGLLHLNRKQAEAALDRHSTEPILWESSSKDLEAFSEALAKEGIVLVRGGHFQHLMPAGQSKGSALTRVLQCYQARNPDLKWKTLAIGDSPNDSSMLEVADAAIVIPNPKRGTLQLKRADYCTAEAPGPVGWGASVLEFLTTQLSIATT
ncbi:MAG: Glucosyl-3-phosphoglycerate/mannosyl-3-phosphoglycerate phosphatase [Opitutia bacterium UBA7350]|nr:MAG: Glucosyl-3-phosphoglycerate/mannosyl-3-phosphoglycerate phosphatase [Opitutae bacterium UBA7350]